MARPSDTSLSHGLADAGSALRHVRQVFRQQAFDTADLDGRMLVCHALGISHEELIGGPERVISDEERCLLDDVIARRIAGEPVSRILGQRSFWRGTFMLNGDTLDPRPDSETLVEAAVECAQFIGLGQEPAEPHKQLNILDLGTGSGCLLISALTELPGAYGFGVDISQMALSVAARNARDAGVNERCSFVCGDWAAALDLGADLIICNPPYICSREIELLDREVRDHDPLPALDGGIDGLDAYRTVIRQAHRLLSPNGWIVLEVGLGQSPAVCDLLEAAGFCFERGLSATLCDLGGRVRCVRATGNGVLTVKL